MEAVSSSPEGTARALQPPGRDASIHWLSLGFSLRELEEEFRTDYARRFLLQVRASLLLAIALYAAFGVLDPYIIPEAKSLAWFVRYAVVCPVFSVVFLLSWSPLVQRHLQPILAGLGLLAGLGIIVMIVRAAAPGNYLYYAGIMLVCTYVCTFFRLRFVVAASTAWSVLLLYELAVYVTGDVPAPVVVSNSFFLLAVNVIGMSACYSMERSVRVDFLQERIIRRQAAELRRALGDVKTLSGLLPICAWCKKVRDDQGYWNQIEQYLTAHLEAKFSHGICPNCAAGLKAQKTSLPMDSREGLAHLHE